MYGGFEEKTVQDHHSSKYDHLVFLFENCSLPSLEQSYIKDNVVYLLLIFFAIISFLFK